MFRTLSDVKAKEIMSPDVTAMTEEKMVSEAVSLMTKIDRGSVVVINKEGELIGIFTERDLMRRVVAKNLDPKKTPLSKVMTKNVFALQTTEDAIKLLELMVEQNFRHIPILDGKNLAGVVSLKQFYKFLLNSRQSMGI